MQIAAVTISETELTWLTITLTAAGFIAGALTVYAHLVSSQPWDATKLTETIDFCVRCGLVSDEAGKELKNVLKRNPGPNRRSIQAFSSLATESMARLYRDLARFSHSLKHAGELDKRESEILRLAKRTAMEMSGFALLLPPEAAERHFASIFRLLGFDAEVTRSGSDGGVDIIMSRGAQRYIVQVKRYTDSKVSGPEVRNLQGVTSYGDDVRRVFVTTSGFSAAAFEEQKTSEMIFLTTQQMQKGDFAGLI